MKPYPYIDPRKAIYGTQGSHTEEEWLALLEKHNSACARCGTVGVRLTEDHIIPITRGGTDSIDNVQPLCVPCNSRKSNKLPHEEGVRNIVVRGYLDKGTYWPLRAKIMAKGLTFSAWLRHKINEELDSED